MVDPILTSKGLKQCRRAASWLLEAIQDLRELEKSRAPDVSPFCIDAFLVSPLTRTLQTASVTMHQLDAGLKCPEPNEIYHPEKRVRWIVENFMREKLSNRTDLNLKLPALFSRLLALYDRGMLLPSVFDFTAMPLSETGFSPFTAEQLEGVLMNMNVEPSSEANAPTDLDKDEGQAEDDNDSGETSSTLRGASTAADAKNDGTILTTPGVHISKLSAPETSVRSLSLRVKAPLYGEEGIRRRYLQTDGPNAFKVERLRDMKTRGKLFLALLCEAEGARTFFAVTHSLFLKVLTKTKMFKNAEIRAFVLYCEVEPRLEKLTSIRLKGSLGHAQTGFE